MNHGFVDGNKRVGFASTIIFLEANGVTAIGAEDEWIKFIYENLEAGTFRKPVIENWLSRHTAPARE
jgi:death-on-curing protein